MYLFIFGYTGSSEKAMAPHSSTLAWKIPWMEEPGRLQSMGSLRVRPDWATSLSLFTFMHWRRKWQPTPMFLPGESQGWGSLVGCRLWGRTWLKRLSSSSILGLHCCGGHSLVVMHGLLIVVASLVVEHRLQGARASAVQPHGSVLVAPGL